MAEAELVGPVVLAERNERIARWLEYVEIIKHQVWELHHHRAIWREMRDALVAASRDEMNFFIHYD